MRESKKYIWIFDELLNSLTQRDDDPRRVHMYPRGIVVTHELQLIEARRSLYLQLK